MNKLKNNIINISWWALLLLLAWLWLNFFLFSKDDHNEFEPINKIEPVKSSQLKQTQISSFHLFGSSETTEIPLNLVGNSESNLNLIITGIIASSNPLSGLAYISNTQGDEKKFKVGDDVFGLAKLVEIHTDHLILENRNQKQTLTFQKSSKISTSQRSKSKQTSQSKTSAQNRINKHIKSNDGNWQDVMNKQKYDPNKIKNYINNVSVVYNNQGQINGLRVSTLTQNDALMKQGLKRNDQIVAINGVEISSGNVLSLQEQITSSENAQLTVMRNGKKITLNVNVSEFKK